MGESEILASDSEMRMMASSCRTVMGIDDRVFAETSTLCTCRRIETKWEESFSAASGERCGAQRLEVETSEWNLKDDGAVAKIEGGETLRLAIANVSLHFFY